MIRTLLIFSLCLLAAACGRGMPDPIMGQRVCAYVVTETKENLQLTEIVSFLRGRKLAPYKLPERLEVVTALPMVSDTKVDKKTLVADITEKLKKRLVGQE